MSDRPDEERAAEPGFDVDEDGPVPDDERRETDDESAEQPIIDDAPSDSIDR